MNQQTSHSFVSSINLRHIATLLILSAGYLFSVGLTTSAEPVQAASIDDTDRKPANEWIQSPLVHDAWLTFEDARHPNKVWATNHTDYDNTTLNAVLDTENQCRASLSLYVNKADMGDKRWITRFPKVIVRADTLPSLHMEGFAYYTPGALIVDLTGRKPLALDMLRLGEQLMVHVNAEKQELGTLHTEFSMNGAEAALRDAEDRCQKKRAIHGNLSELSL